MKRFRRAAALLAAMALTLSLTACNPTQKPASDAQDEKQAEQPKQSEQQPKELEKITFVLDWAPNTNHTGLYVAMEKGYFEQEGLQVEVVQPPEDGAEVLVASGRAQFGVSFQDYAAAALSAEPPLEITAVAALVQHNTSGILSRKGEGMHTPKGLEGRKYATWNTPVEQATLRQVVEKDGGDFDKVELIPSTVSDEVSALQSKAIDAIWVFYGWGGIACQTAGLDTDYFSFKDIDPVFDFYTPIVIGSNQFLAGHPDTARAFLKALAHGYEDAARDPQAAAEILMKAAPELKDSRDLILASQSYLSQQYIADAPHWGVFDEQRWSGFFEWLNDNNLLERPIEPTAGFTNDFLPSAS